MVYTVTVTIGIIGNKHDDDDDNGLIKRRHNFISARNV